MGDAWLAPSPRCPTHGQMSYVSHLFRGIVGARGWACWGYDGEGCSYSVSWDELDWVPLSAESVKLNFEPGSPIQLRATGRPDE